MIRQVSADARPGDVVAVYDKQGKLFGHGLYNPRSAITLRMLSFEDRQIDDDFWRETIARAVSLRQNLLRLNERSDACRLIHAEGDGLSGLIVDCYGDVLSVEVFSLGMWRRAETLVVNMHEAAGTKHHLITADVRAQQQEGFSAKPIVSEGCPGSVKITENGVRFRVQFAEGHKTGFFCDQRENRRRLAEMVEGGQVLDLCSYSGGFGLYAKVRGRADTVTCVDLDEETVAMTRKNADLNSVRIQAVHSDAFIYMRQMLQNQRQFETVVLDPPKLIFGRNDTGEGRAKYFDLNKLAAALVCPGGLLLTCSCSGAMSRDEFVQVILGAVRHAGRTCQILNITGAGEDHPISPYCPESAYLKAVWLRVW
jgi:23S rRNA (cytosine1962-C5)-methyltransferase